MVRAVKEASAAPRPYPMRTGRGASDDGGGGCGIAQGCAEAKGAGAEHCARGTGKDMMTKAVEGRAMDPCHNTG